MQKNSRNERTVVPYAMLLNLAHQRGLRSIKTALLQIPSADNGWVAIARAEASLCGEDGIERVFEEIGDAGPTNLAPMVAACAIRMAATRAKARALRDAVNVGAVAAEELSDYDEAAAYTPAVRPASVRRMAAEAGDPCTDEQRRAILKLCNQRGVEIPENLDAMTQGQAADLLTTLQKRAA